jgi:hypothetical protein
MQLHSQLHSSAQFARELGPPSSPPPALSPLSQPRVHGSSGSGSGSGSQALATPSRGGGAAELAPSEFEAALRTFYARHEPAMVPSVRSLQRSCKQSELICALKCKYGASPVLTCGCVHPFERTSFWRRTVCGVCHCELADGMLPVGFHCRLCGINVHKQCMDAPHDGAQHCSLDPAFDVVTEAQLRGFYCAINPAMLPQVGTILAVRREAMSCAVMPCHARPEPRVTRPRQRDHTLTPRRALFCCRRTPLPSC